MVHAEHRPRSGLSFNGTEAITAALPISQDFEKELAGPRRSPSLFFRLVCGEAGFATLEKTWCRVVKAIDRPQFFHLYAWHKSHVETVEPEGERLFIVAYDPRGPVGIVPIVRVQKQLYGLALRGLEVPVHPLLPLSDIVFAPTTAGPQFTRLLSVFLRNCGIRWDYLLIPNVLPDSCAFPLLNPGRALCHAMTSHTCEYVPSIIKYREKARRAKKRLLRAGEFTVSVVREKAELRYCYDLFLNDDMTIWPSGNQAPPNCVPSLPRFFRSLIKNAAGEGQCEMHLLKLEGRCIAVLFSLVVDDIAYAIKIGFDQQHAAFAPGWILLDSWLKQTLKQGRNAYLMADTDYHHGFDPLTSDVFNLYLFNTTPAGILASGITRLESCLSSSSSAQPARPLVTSL